MRCQNAGTPPSIAYTAAIPNTVSTHKVTNAYNNDRAGLTQMSHATPIPNATTKLVGFASATIPSPVAVSAAQAKRAVQLWRSPANLCHHNKPELNSSNPERVSVL